MSESEPRSPPLLSPETVGTIVHVWRAVMAALVLGVGFMIFQSSERSQKTADKVTWIDTQMASLTATLDAVKNSNHEMKSAINFSVLRILEEHTRQISSLQERDSKMIDELGSLKVQIARQEAELSNFRRALDKPPAGRPR